MIRFFWRNFFSLLLVFVAAAEWACVAWLATQLFGAETRWWAHVLGPTCIYFLNTVAVVRTTRARPAVRFARRIYVGVAFASIFGAVFLLATGALWGLGLAGATLLGALGAQVSTAPVHEAAAVMGTAGLFGVAGLMAYGYAFGQRRLTIERRDVALRELRAPLAPLRVVQISDLHLGPFMSAEKMRGYVERVNALAPDLVCITGDITDGLDHAAETFPVLGELRARLGVFAVLGNHDMYAGGDAVTAELRRRTGITVLRDEVGHVESDGHRLYLVGLDDRGLDWARGLRRHPTLEGLIRAVPAGEPYIVLSHRPDPFEHAAQLGAGLTLAGHTHGGQLALPWFGDRRPSLAHFITAYPRGTFAIGDSTLHVNLGLGVTGQPVRIASPREITLITLKEKGDSKPC